MRIVHIAAACSLIACIGSSGLGQLPGAVSTREVRFNSNGVELAATIYLPASPRSVPGVVIVHGSGTSARDNPWTTAWARALSSRGIAVLYPDKRGSGASQGDWRSASLETLATDASAALRALRQVDGIDTSRASGAVGDFDPMPYWKDARYPVFFLLGGRDTQVNVPETLRTLWNGVGQDHPLFSIMVLQGSGHGIFRDDAVAFVSEWVRNGRP